MWWHRMPSSFQGPPVLGLGFLDLPVLLAGRGIPTLGFFLLCPRRVPAWMIPWVPSWMVRRSPQCQGWPAAQIPTHVGVTSSVQSNLTVGAFILPQIMSSPTLPIPAPFHPNTWSLHPGQQWNLQGGGFQWPPELPWPGIIPWLCPRSAGLGTKFSWSVPGSSPAVAPWPVDSWSVQVCCQKKTRPCVIIIPWLSDVRVYVPELLDWK